MGAVLGWPPLVWAMRIALLVLLAGCSYVYLLLIAPFFRPKNVRSMVTAGLPRIWRIEAEIAGTRGGVHFVHDPPVSGTEEATRRTTAADVDTELEEGDNDTGRGREVPR